MFRQPFSFASYVYAGPLKDNLQCMRTQRQDQIGVVSDVLACNPEFEKRATNFQCYVDTCKESDSKVFGLMRRKFSGSKYQSSRCNGSLFNALGLSSSSPHVKSQKQLILLYVPLILDSLLPPFPMSLLISLSLSLKSLFLDNLLVYKEEFKSFCSLNGVETLAPFFSLETFKVVKDSRHTLERILVFDTILEVRGERAWIGSFYMWLDKGCFLEKNILYYLWHYLILYRVGSGCFPREDHCFLEKNILDYLWHYL